jgi:hypothetical protein
MPRQENALQKVVRTKANTGVLKTSIGVNGLWEYPSCLSKKFNMNCFGGSDKPTSLGALDCENSMPLDDSHDNIEQKVLAAWQPVIKVSKREIQKAQPTRHSFGSYNEGTIILSLDVYR